MSLILIISILIRITAIGWSIVLWRQLRDWRMAFLMVMLGLMATRQIFTLTKDYQGWFLNITTHVDELPGLAVSILALIVVIIFQKILAEQKIKDKSIRENEDRLSQVLKGFQEGHWDWNIITGEQWWSDNFYRLLGYEQQDIKSSFENFLKLLHPDDKEHTEKKVKALLEDHVPYKNQYRLKRKTGEYNWFRSQAQAVWDEEGNPIRMSGSILDISNSIKAEEALQVNEERLKLVMEGSQDGHWYWDILQDSGWWSAQFYHLLGYEDGEIPPTYESFFERLHPDDKERMLKKQNEHLENKKPYDIEYRLLKKSGEYGWFRARGQAIWDKQGKPVRMAGSIQDINDRKVAEIALIESEEKYRSIVEITPEWIWELDLNGYHTYSNNSVEHLLGYKASELIGHSASQIMSPEVRDDIAEMVSEFIRNKTGWTGLIVPWIHKDGSIRYLESNASPVFDSNNEIIGYRGADRDITERIKAEKELQFTYFAIDHFTDAAYWIGDQGQFVYVNEAACKSLGYSKEELLTMYVFDIDPVFKKENWDSYWMNTEENYFRTFETVHKRKDGTTFPVEIVSNHLEYEGKYYRCTFARDIQERKQSEAAIQVSEARYRMLYDNNPSMFFTIDQNLKVISVNQFGASQLGYKSNELIGSVVLDVFVDDDKNKAYEYLQACLSEPDELHRWELRKVCKDGSILWVRETARVVSDENNNASIFIVCEDISETHLLSEQLSYQASHDALTGLINRREFENRLLRIIDTARKSKTEHVLCYLDLDQFKIINDSCGHFAGDSLLKEVSQLIQKHIRKRDTLARLGGDEFGILMEHCNIEQAENVANSVLKEVEAFRYNWENKDFTIGVSMGLVTIDDTVTDHIEVLRKADAACYAAKDAGRNRIHIYSEDDSSLVQRHGEMQWVNRIKRALDENEFELYVQPIVSTDFIDEDVSKYEVLIRLIEDNGSNIIAPGLFLPAAERYNLATKIDRWVINTIFKIFKEHAETLSLVKLWSINLSGQSVADEDFLKFVISKLEANENIADKICFEITETAAISNIQTAAGFMRSLKELGCQFSLDDFGSGLSSFAYLKTLPVDYLKIDGFFVKDIVEDEADYAMVKSINEISQVMGIESIAEFVENDAIKQRLIEIGVDYVQGYGIGKPIPLKSLFSKK
jgi:diguanylate cyclase (GGDEF)-like protein/PAS domain S-box-containing protein